VSESPILFELKDGIAHVTLNKPTLGNSMDIPFAKELMLIANRCDLDPEIRAVLITAKGKLFSVGGDLKSFYQMGDAMPLAMKEMTTYLHTAASRFARCRPPVVLAAQGAAAGAALSLVATADFALAGESTKFTMAYTGVALSPDGGSSYFLPRLIGTRRTTDLMITNRQITAQTAENWGLINRVVPDDELITEATKLATKLAAGPTGSYGAIKSLLRQTYKNGLEEQMEEESQHFIASLHRDDFQEGVTAFIEKRKPAFKGQ